MPHDSLITVIENQFKFVDAGYATFQLVFKEKVYADEHLVDATTDFNAKIIELTRFLPDSTAKETMYHELTHIVLEMAGLGEDASTKLTNEEMTLNISRSFMTIIRLNRDLFNVLEEYDTCQN